MKSIRFFAPWFAAALLFGAPALPAAEPEPDRTAVAIEALSRLKGVDLESSPAVKAAVLKIVGQVRGRPQFVELVRDFKLKDQDVGLLEIATQRPAEAAGVDATRLLLENHATALLQQTLTGTNVVAAAHLAEALGNTGEQQAVPLLEPVVADATRDLALRQQAVRALAKTPDGATALLRLAKESRLPADLKSLAGAELGAVRWPAVKAEAAQVLPPPAARGDQPLPPIAELVKLTGDATRGAVVFARDEVGCLKCHQVNGRGVDFGPALSEIGAKLAREAIYEAILDPSAGISFGFEAWQFELKNGDEAFGLIASETADEVAVKAVGGIVTRLRKSDLAKREQQKLSIMPAGLQLTMSQADLVDLVEYLASLKKAAP